MGSRCRSWVTKITSFCSQSSFAHPFLIQDFISQACTPSTVLRGWSEVCAHVHQCGNELGHLVGQLNKRTKLVRRPKTRGWRLCRRVWESLSAEKCGVLFMMDLWPNGRCKDKWRLWWEETNVVAYTGAGGFSRCSASVSCGLLKSECKNKLPTITWPQVDFSASDGVCWAH